MDNSLESMSQQPAAPMTTRVIQRTTAFARYLQMLRQFSVVNAAINELDLAERKKIGLTALAELAQVQTEVAENLSASVIDWSVEAALAFARVRSPHYALRITGIRRWLVAAYRASFESSYGEIQNLHRAVLRAMRTMHGNNSTNTELQYTGLSDR